MLCNRDARKTSLNSKRAVATGDQFRSRLYSLEAETQQTERFDAAVLPIIFEEKEDLDPSNRPLSPLPPVTEQASESAVR